MTRDAEGPIRDDELDALFRPLRGRRLALAVSGGLDSMVLLHLIGRWLATNPSFDDCRKQPPREISDIGLPRAAPELSARAEWLRPSPEAPTCADLRAIPPVVVLTVDHDLRPESAAEAAFVADAAAALNLPHQTLVWRHADVDRANGADVQPDRSGRPSTGIQAKARAARYDLLADVIEDEVWRRFAGGDRHCHPLSGPVSRRTLLTAHHREDLVETFLMRLQRGSGLGGLAAMRPIATLWRPPTRGRRYPSPIDIARPLLDVPRPRLLATARRANLAWREDSSNADQRFERIRLRAQAPTLAAQGLDVTSLHRTVRRLRAARDALETDCGRWIDRAVETNGGLYGEVVLRDPNRTCARLPPDEEPSTEILLGILRHVIRAFGGVHPAPELSKLEALAARIAHAGEIGKGFTSTLGGCRIRTDGAVGHPVRTRVWREHGRAALPELTLAPGDGGWWDDRFAVSASPTLEHLVTIRALGDGGWAEVKRRVPALATWTRLPPGAVATLPAVWRGTQLLAAPWFDDVPATLPSDLRRRIHDAFSMTYATQRNLYRIAFRQLERG